MKGNLLYEVIAAAMLAEVRRVLVLRKKVVFTYCSYGKEPHLCSGSFVVYRESVRE